MRHVHAVVFGCLVATATVGWAQDQDAPGGAPAEDVGTVRRPVEPPAVEVDADGTEDDGGADRPLALEVQVEIKTAYVFRGYTVIDTGYIVQPEATVSLRPLELGPYALSPYAGVWNNVSEAKGPDTSVWSHWTEFDVAAGVVVERGEWSLELQYNYYAFPSDLSDPTDELGAILTYGGALFGASLSPHVTLFRELNDEADGDENTYLEAGVEPEFELTEKVTLSTPLTLGMSLDGYYTDAGGRNELLGYASAAARPAWQLNDNWSVYAGVEYVYLFADSAEAANDGDADKVIGVVGVTFTY